MYVCMNVCKYVCVFINCTTRTKYIQNIFTKKCYIYKTVDISIMKIRAQIEEMLFQT